MKKHKPLARSTVKRPLRPLGSPAQAGTSSSAPVQSKTEFQRVVHELQVHQEELEAQNEELRETQQLLEASRDRYADLYDFAPIGYATLDGKGHIREINLTGATILGRERSRLLGTLFSVVVAKGDLGVFHGHLRQCQQGSGPVTTELILAVRDRDPVPVQLHSLPFLDLIGQTTMYRTAIIDITVRKQAEKAAIQLAAIVESSDDAIIGENLDGTVQSWNTGAEKIFGYTAGEMVGRSMTLLVPADRPEEENHILGKIMHGESLRHFETVRQAKNGRRIDVSVTASPIKDSRGKIIGASKVSRDITGRKQAEKILRLAHDQLEDRVRERTAELAGAVAGLQKEIVERKRAEDALKVFRSLMDHSNDSLEVIDPDTARFLDVSLRGCTDLGYSHDELLSLRIFDINPEVDPSAWPAHIEALRRDKSMTVSGRHRRKDGTAFPVEVNISFVRLDRDYVVAVVRDVTERKQAEEALRQLSVRLLQTQDEERRRIARELHDSTGQQLAALAMNLSLVGKSAETLDTRARKALAESQALLDRSSRDIRTLSYLLHPPLLDDRGLAAAVRWFTDGFTERSGVQVKLEVPPDLRRLPEEIEMALFRIVQESLTNIHRHSGSSTATIRLMVDQNQIQLEMRDAGKGLPKPQSNGYVAPLGVGITGMRERVKQLGGQMQMESGSSGTTVSVILPLTRATS